MKLQMTCQEKSSVLMLYDSSIEESFYHTWDFLTLCAEKGIIINADKLQFCRDTVIFAELTIMPTGITPSNSLFSAINPIQYGGGPLWPPLQFFLNISRTT